MKNPYQRHFAAQLPGRAQRNIGELIAKRDDARTDPIVAHAIGELRVIKREAYQRWHERAFCYGVRDGLGYKFLIGYYAPTDPGPSVPPWKRHEVVVASGRSHAEVIAMLAAVERAM